MSLLHHWILSTSQTISESVILDSYWQTVFPQIAFLHPFVMHGILSIAALHLGYLQGANKERRMIDAARHHNVALQGFREHLARPSDDNSDALFACASLNLLYVFGLPIQRHDRQHGEAEPASRISRILGAEWIPMSRGVEAVLQSVYDRVRLGPLRAMLDLRNWVELSPNNEPS
ncbi:hypothetical protein SLS60_012059 [Paraconiothyrium brasiliense]|uniref:Uncharacterized protein n=1 Tax=Paraconiothyrium brasiliense TaxID=300254 RepID=A0ABR3QGS2_9PLEO